MTVCSAKANWSGGLRDGGGNVSLQSGAGTFTVTLPGRSNDSSGEATSPEELLAAAVGSCWAMGLAAEIVEAGGTPGNLSVQADVSVDALEGGGHGVTHLGITVRGTADGLDEEGFRAAAQRAQQYCPVSKALAGVSVSLDAAFA